MNFGAPEDLSKVGCNLHGMGDRVRSSSVECNCIQNVESARIAHSLLLHHMANHSESLPCESSHPWTPPRK